LDSALQQQSARSRDHNMAVWRLLLPKTLLYAAVVGLLAVVLFRSPRVGDIGGHAALAHLEVLTHSFESIRKREHLWVQVYGRDGLGQLQRSRSQWSNGRPSKQPQRRGPISAGAITRSPLTYFVHRAKMRLLCPSLTSSAFSKPLAWLQHIWDFIMPDHSRKPKFRKLQSFKTDFAPTNITLYESERSGMQVIVADQQGPKIHGYFTLATEATDDSGAPHTLEHLVFMGSENYRYKGLLDKLASRAYSGTNAWTATDHTAYTLETAGWDGFAQILPIYLEHVLLPTITDEACLTEVHHVDGEGNDAGVVYSEMQALQYSSGELMDLRARRLLYPEHVGFRYETGGMTEALRSLSADRIREFHRDMYQPRNMAVIIIGETNHDHLLQILDDFEESIKAHLPLPSAHYKR
jgi:hypothetical protein